MSFFKGQPGIYGNTVRAGSASADLRVDRPQPNAGTYTFLQRNPDYSGFPTPLLETIHDLGISEVIPIYQNYNQSIQSITKVPSTPRSLLTRVSKSHPLTRNASSSGTPQSQTGRHIRPLVSEREH
jgi:hypothetical protein